jgi:hypothetical protein
VPSSGINSPMINVIVIGCKDTIIYRIMQYLNHITYLINFTFEASRGLASGCSSG